MFQSGDTVLIGAVRGGHVEIVRALLHKYADIDIRGQVRFWRHISFITLETVSSFLSSLDVYEHEKSFPFPNFTHAAVRLTQMIFYKCVIIT